MSEELTDRQVLEADWDREQIDALFDDLRDGAIIQHVQIRPSSDTGPQDKSVTLGEARQLLECGAAKAVQIRYEFQGQTWCDTLMVGPALTRIVRTQLP